MADAFAVDLDKLADIVERMAAYQAVVDSMLEECDAVVANLHAQWEASPVNPMPPSTNSGRRAPT